MTGYQTAAYLAGFLVLATAFGALVVWNRYTVRAYERRQGPLEDASLEELMHPGDDCTIGGLETANAAPVGPPRWMQRCPCGHKWLDHDIEEYAGDGTDLCCVESCDQNGCPGRAAKPTLREDAIDVPAADPIIPLERLYDAGGFVKLGKLILHDHCKDLRRDGRYSEICGDCAPSLVGSAAKLPPRREP